MSAPEPCGGAPKHRACDECRSRKLACTKEPDGCSRCKREGITCHYSAQKPMGRPRKRPRDDTNEVNASAESAPSKAPMIDIPPDTEDPGLAFLSFLSGQEFDIDPLLPENLLDQPQQQDKEDWTFGYTGNDFTQLNFNAAPEQTTSIPPSNIDPALFDSAGVTPDVPVPGLSSDKSSSPSSSASPPSLGPTNCACTASLYLSLDRMQKLPANITEAVRQARLASKTAYQVVNCPSCSVPVDASPTSPLGHIKPQVIQNFQLLMLLAALIPSIVHAYERILELVEIETEKARREHRQMCFTLDNYGGVWGALEDECCGAGKYLSNRMMEPTLWRLSVRALMRVDVYGIGGSCDNHLSDGTSSAAVPAEALHLGLKDIVVQMENRSRARHAIMDPLIQSGQWKDPDCVLKMHKTGDTPTCMRIIQIAKTAVDNLVIA